MTNLYAETEEALKSHGKTFADVVFVSGGGHEITKDDFIRIAMGLNYNDGYGTQYIPDDLVIVGDGWWLERGEYDGSEWWEFKTQPKRPDDVCRLADIDTSGCYGRYVYQKGGAE